jgi:hypothetical protein
VNERILNFIIFLLITYSLYSGLVPTLIDSRAEETTIEGVFLSGLCRRGIATSTIYNVPTEDNMCPPRENRCQRFIEAVNLNGTGWLRNGQILRANRSRPESIGSCLTAVGAWGTCLTPYISIAADIRGGHYQYGDIIEMPEMRGKPVTFPNGSVMSHPGFFRVEDTGSAIRGRNRFDFFTGTLRLDNPRNSFGQESANTDMHAKTECQDRKRFTKLHRGSQQYLAAFNQINQSLSEAGQPTLPEGRQSITATAQEALRQREVRNINRRSANQPGQRGNSGSGAQPRSGRR